MRVPSASITCSYSRTCTRSQRTEVIPTLTSLINHLHPLASSQPSTQSNLSTRPSHYHFTILPPPNPQHQIVPSQGPSLRPLSPLSLRISPQCLLSSLLLLLLFFFFSSSSSLLLLLFFFFFSSCSRSKARSSFCCHCRLLIVSTGFERAVRRHGLREIL